MPTMISKTTHTQAWSKYRRSTNAIFQDQYVSWPFLTFH